MGEPESKMEKRSHLRYHAQKTRVIQLFYFDGDGVRVDAPALLADESHKGMAVILVGFHPLPEKSTIYWQETENLRTDCTVIHFKELDENVYRLALELRVLPSQPPRQRGRLNS